jgi:prolyl 3-hydroxylase /prolyl 3,4-dihydroxylase
MPFQSLSSIKLDPYSDLEDTFVPSSALTDEETAFLSQYLNPVYLSEKTIAALASRFVDESSLDLHDFLDETISSRLESSLRHQDTKDGYTAGSRAVGTPSHQRGAGLEAGWKIVGPPHKRRYCLLYDFRLEDSIAAHYDSHNILRSIQDELFPSTAFRSWLAMVTSLLPLAHTVEARRFRPGLDYTLARSEGKPRLDVCLNLTPKQEQGPGWETGSWGGWEVSCFSAPNTFDSMTNTTVVVLYGATRRRR